LSIRLAQGLKEARDLLFAARCSAQGCSVVIALIAVLESERADELSTMQVERAQQVGDRERSEAVANLFEDLLPKERSEDRSALGRTGGTQSPARAGEGEQVVALAVIAVHPGKVGGRSPQSAKG
jgi:hypothetical protein